MSDAKSQPTGDVDLFGNPKEPIRDRRGRPSFAKNKENQQFVAVRAANGWSHARIANALGCDDDTLRKHFSGELENGRMIIEGMMLDVLMVKIREGHVPSIRMMQERLETVAPTAPRKQPPPKPEDAKPKPAEKPLGKKEQKLIDAGEVPSEWGDIAASRRQ